MAVNKNRNGQTKPTDTASTESGAPADPNSEQKSKPEGEAQTDPKQGANPEEQPNPDQNGDTSPPQEPGETITALALVDHGPFNLRCGYLSRVPAEAAEQLETDGVIDTHENAIAAGKQPAADEAAE